MPGRLKRLVQAYCSPGSSAEALVECRQTLGLRAQPDSGALASALASWPSPTFQSLRLIRPVQPPGCGTGAVDTPRFEVNEKALSKLRQVRELQSLAVVGNVREGKSELNNRVADRLSNRERMERREPMFSTSSGLRSHTRGVHVYLVPRRLRRPELSGFYALFDFEGFGDLEKDSEYGTVYDTKLFAIALRCVDVLVYNRRSGFDAMLMDTFASFGLLTQILTSGEPRTAGQEPSHDRHKVPLMVTLRDFTLQDQERDPQTYFADLAAPELPEHVARSLAEGERGECLRVRRVLGRYFSEIAVHTFDRPADDRADLAQLYRLPLTALRRDFQKDFASFFDSLTRRLDGRGVTDGESYALRLAGVVRLVSAGHCEASSLQLVARTQCSRGRELAAEQWEELAAAVRATLPMSDGELRHQMRLLERGAQRKLQEVLQGSCDAEQLQRQGDILQDRVSRWNEDLKLANGLKTCEVCAKILNDRFQQACGDMDQYRHPKGTETDFKRMWERVLRTFDGDVSGASVEMAAIQEHFRRDKEAVGTALRSFNETAKRHEELVAKNTAALRDMEEAQRRVQERLSKAKDSGASLEE